MNCTTKMEMALVITKSSSVKVKLVMKTSYELRHPAAREPVLSPSSSWSFLLLLLALLVLFFIMIMINSDINTITNIIIHHLGFLRLVSISDPRHQLLAGSLCPPLLHHADHKMSL